MSTPHHHPGVVVLVHAVEGDGVTQRADENGRLHERQVRQVVLPERRNGLGELGVVVHVVVVHDVRALKDYLFTSAECVANFDSLLDIWICLFSCYLQHRLV